MYLLGNGWHQLIENGPDFLGWVNHHINANEAGNLQCVRHGVQRWRRDIEAEKAGPPEDAASERSDELESDSK